MKSKVISILSLHASNKNICVLFRLKFTNSGEWSNYYSILAVETLHLLHMGVSKELMEYTAAYSSSTAKLISILTRRREMNRTIVLTINILCRWNNLFATYERNSLVPAIQVAWLTSYRSGSLNRLFASSGLEEVSESKNLFKSGNGISFCSDISERMKNTRFVGGLWRISNTFVYIWWRVSNQSLRTVVVLVR